MNLLYKPYIINCLDFFLKHAHQNFHRACSIFVALELFRIKVSIFSVFTILSQIYSTLSVTNPNTLDVGKYQIENLATLVNFRKATVMWLQFFHKNLSILSQRS